MCRVLCHPSLSCKDTRLCSFFCVSAVKAWSLPLKWFTLNCLVTIMVEFYTLNLCPLPSNIFFHQFAVYRNLYCNCLNTDFSSSAFYYLCYITIIFFPSAFCSFYFFVWQVFLDTVIVGEVGVEEFSSSTKPHPPLTKWHTIDSNYREDYCAVKMSASRKF